MIKFHRSAISRPFYKILFIKSASEAISIAEIKFDLFLKEIKLRKRIMLKRVKGLHTLIQNLNNPFYQRKDGL
jgi:hypothetical protein